MAGVEIKGFQELVRNCNYLSKEVLGKALQAAEDAAAQVVRQAVESAAPRKTGQLTESVKVFESTDRKALTGSPRRRSWSALTRRRASMASSCRRAGSGARAEGNVQQAGIPTASPVRPKEVIESRHIHGSPIQRKLKRGHLWQEKPRSLQ